MEKKLLSLACLRLLAIPVSIGVLTGAYLGAQVPSVADATNLAFEVASIKESRSLEGNGTIGPRPGGRVSAVNCPLRTLILWAYQVAPYQISGGPGWIGLDRFNLDAKADGNPSLEQLRAMARALLADRFQLAVHRETREADGFALVRIRPDRLGPNLLPSTVDCSVSFATTPRCREGGIGIGSFKSVGMSLSLFAAILGSVVGGPIADKTQLPGTFDAELKWSPDIAPSGDLPSIFTALQEQLGLKLERTRVPIEVLVVDHAERPTPD